MAIWSEQVLMRIESSGSSDVELARAAAAGDNGAARELVGRLLRCVRRTMSYLCAQDPLAEDLTQEALIRILERADTYRGESSLEFWAMRVAVRTATSELAKQSNRRRLFKKLSLRAAQMVAKESPCCETLTGEEQVRRRLGRVLERLPVEQRTVVVLRHVEGYDLAELARLTGAPVNTVRARLRQGMAKLRRLVGTDPALREWAKERTRW